MADDFLLEIGTEDLPAKTLPLLSEALGREIKNLLLKAELSHGDIALFAAPRRLAVLIHQVAATQHDRQLERKGPALAAAFDAQGSPTKACLGFAQSCGVRVDQLQRQKSDKGEFLFYSHHQPGERAENLLPDIVNAAIKNLPIPKPMRWGAATTAFIRPVHWIVMLYGNAIIAAKILGVMASRETRGHRFHHPQPITLNSPADYVKKLFAAKVMANFNERKEKIRQQLTKVTKDNGHAIVDEDLLQEVTGLVEWPVALLGNFEPRFLEIPKEAVISSMKTHQKCFPVIDEKHHLLSQFITVCNIESAGPQRVIQGNERVIRARLSDAEFFYHTDLKHSLESRVEKLNTIIFQRKLGTLYDKSQRLLELSGHIASKIKSNIAQAERAGLLAKADLLTAMVGEFPELQGIMGYYYALQDKEAEAVAVAIKEQYLPRFAGDVLPETPIGCALAIADRIDTLVGIFGINQAPTGEKDPFGLRRAALGVLRIIIENQLPLDLKETLEHAKNNYPVLENKQVVTDTLNFMLERLNAWYADQHIDADVFAAVLATGLTAPLNIHHRIKALQHFQTLAAAKSLAAAHKRVNNILKKQDGVSIHTQINPSLFQLDAEYSLATALEKKAKETEELYRTEQYTEALTSLAELQKPVDDFFDQVMVMVEDEKLRHNRLALLISLRNLFLQVADISLLQMG